MSQEESPLRVYILPFICPGHMIPLVDLATLLALRGVAVTIITTPANEPLILPTLCRSASLPHPIRLLLLPFPSSVRHLLPQGGQENLASVSFSSFRGLYDATFALHRPILDLLRPSPPDALISDSVFSWSADVARELGIPRLVFHGPGLFAVTVHDTIHLQSPHLSVSSDSYPFLVPGLPHRVELTKSELPESFFFPHALDMKRDGDKKSFGIIVNTFFDLEPEYAEIYMKEPGRRTWLIGPVSLVRKDKNDLSNRGRDPDADPAWLLSWLDAKPASSVLYVCFGSLCEFGDDQLNEIGAGLEASGHPFIWVVRKNLGENLSPAIEEIKRRVGGRGIIVHGWAPQVAILGHPAVGGFMTHCGWNSTLEGVSAGVAMLAWPLFYEQYINQRLITDVLKIGVRVPRVGRNMLLVGWKNDVVKAEEVARAVERVMGKGEEAKGMRRRAKEYGEKARAAMEVGGSSHEDLGRLIHELMACREDKRKNAEGLIGDTT